jgi:hypothetical protein
MESYVSGASYPIALTGGIGNTCLIDGCLAQNPTGGAFVYENAMTGLQIGFLAGYSPPLVNASDGGTPQLLPNGQGIFDDYNGNPQLREGDFFIQGETTVNSTLWQNGYYTSSGLYYVNAGPVGGINYEPNNNGTYQFLLFPTNSAGHTESVLNPVAVSIDGVHGMNVSNNLIVGGTLDVTNLATLHGSAVVIGSLMVTNPGSGYRVGNIDNAGNGTLMGSLNATNGLFDTQGGSLWQGVITANASGLTNIPASKLTGGPVTNAIATGAALISGNASGVTNTPAVPIFGFVSTLPASSPGYWDIRGTIESSTALKAQGPSLAGVYSNFYGQAYGLLAGTNFTLTFTTNNVATATVLGPFTNSAGTANLSFTNSDTSHAYVVTNGESVGWEITQQGTPAASVVSLNTVVGVHP